MPSASTFCRICHICPLWIQTIKHYAKIAYFPGGHGLFAGRQTPTVASKTLVRLVENNPLNTIQWVSAMVMKMITTTKTVTAGHLNVWGYWSFLWFKGCFLNVPVPTDICFTEHVDSSIHRKGLNCLLIFKQAGGWSSQAYGHERWRRVLIW